MSEEDKITENQLKDPVEMEKDHVEKDIIGQGDGSEAPYEKTTFVVDGEDDEDEEDAEEEEIGIQLGFIDKENPHNSLFLDKDWENWDGGKVGGLPIWLDPASIPDARELSCDVCKEPMCFLLQVYCPLDNVSRAFHRVVYIFSCKKRSCLDAKRGMKCFRSQLPRRNPYYEYEPTKECKVISNQSQEWGGIHLCGLCGCKATNACSNCKSTYYCSRSHQKAHWKTHKKKCSPSSSLLSPNPTDLDEAQRKYLFPENSIYVEEEEEISLPTANPSATTKEEKPANAANNALFQDMMKEGKVWDDAITTGDHPDEEKDAKLTQNDYNQALSEQIHDPIYIQFLTRIDTSGKNQVLRYCETSYHRKIDENNGWHSDQVESKVQHHGKLYTSLEMKKEEVKVPPCPHCGGPRVFEFQIMPQLLYYLNVDKNTEVQPLVDESNPTSITTTELEQEKDKVKYSLHNQKDEDLNWGVIDVYTCVNSCFDNETFQKSSEMKNPFLHSNKSEEYLHWQILPEK